jgi:hypothetical protein
MAASEVGLLVAITAGMLAASSPAWALVAYCGVTLAAVVLDEALSLGPLGPAFFVLVVGAGLTIGTSHVPLGRVLPPVVLGAIVALLAAMAGADKPAPATDPYPCWPVLVALLVDTGVAAGRLSAGTGVRPALASAGRRSGLTPGSQLYPAHRCVPFPSTRSVPSQWCHRHRLDPNMAKPGNASRASRTWP